MAKQDDEKKVIEFLKSQGLDPEAVGKELVESKERIERLRNRIQVIRGRVRTRGNFAIRRQE